MRLILFLLLGFYVSFSMSLEELIRFSEEKNPKLAAKRYKIQSARLNLKAERQLYFPEVFSLYKFSWHSERQSITIPPFGGLPAFEVSSSKRSHQSYQMGIRQTLYDGGLRSSRVSIGEGEVHISEKDYEETRLEVKLELMRAYLSALSAKELLEVAKKQKEAVEADLRQREAFFREGLVAVTDVLQARVKLAEVERDLRKAEGDYAVALADLSRLTGLEEESLKNLTPPKLDLKGYSLDQLLATTLEKRPIIKAFEERLKMKAFQKRAELSQFYPKVFFEALYNYSDQNPSLSPKGFFSFGAGISLNFQFLGPYYKTLSLEEESKSLKEEFKDVKEMLILKVKTAYERLKTAEDNLKVADEALKFAEEFYRLSLEQYRNQLISGADLLQAEASLTQARKARVITYYDLLRAYFELMREVGEL
ncbi:MAG: TolC family protein [Aquificaceae bacterium]|nr:TolC family protein [Aquificaceae bacterium]